MKKSLLIASACLFLFSLTASAQITKGSVLLGGGISGGKHSYEPDPYENRSSSLNFYPTIGIAVEDNAVVGLRLSYFASKDKQTGNNYFNEQKLEGYGAGVFYRRYMNLSQRFFLFGEAGLSYSQNTYTQNKGNTQSKRISHGVNLDLFPGVAFAVSKKFHLELGLNDLLDVSYNRTNYESTSGTNISTSKSSGFGISTNVSTSAPLMVGFRFVLGK